MPDPEFESHAEAKRRQEFSPAPGRLGEPPTRVVARINADDAWRRVQAILAGDRRVVAQLPQLVAQLDRAKQQSLWGRLEELRKLGGDVVLEVMRTLDATPAEVIEQAFVATPTVSTSRLRRYLRSLTAREVGEIDSFHGIRQRLTGSLVEELPAVIREFEQVTANRALVRWLVERTPPSLCASILASHPNPALARSLDAEQLWGWLDHLPPGPSYAALRHLLVTNDDVARAKLTASLGPAATDDDAALQEHRAAHRSDLEDAVVGRAAPDRAKLVAIVANAGSALAQMQPVKIGRLLRRARATPDDVIHILEMGFVGHRAGLAMLLATPGVTRIHVVRYAMLFRDPSELLTVLRDDKIRAAARRHLGNRLALRDLVPIDEASQHLLLEDEALRNWYLKDATPDDLLAICGGGSDSARRACRLVKQLRGSEWIYSLSPGANHAHLRVLATHCGDAKASKFIREVLIGEEVSRTPTVAGSVASDARVYSGERDRLREAVYAGDNDGVLARLADLDDAQRAGLAQDHAALPALFQRIGRDNKLRALELLDLSFAATVAYAAPASGFARELVVHLRLRPAAEEHAALQDKALVERAIHHVHPDPLQTFPSLLEPERLARAIEVCPALVERMLSGSESSRALRLLEHRAVRPKFEALVKAHPEWIDLLPRYQHLDKTAQKRFDALADAMPRGSGAEAALLEIQDGVYEDGDRRREEDARVQSKARDKADGSVADAIRVLAMEGGDTAGAMVLISEHHDELVAMLDQPSRWPTIEQLARLVDLPPHLVFKVGLDRLLLMANSRRWLFEVTPAFVLLKLLATVRDAGVLVGVASAVNQELNGSMRWLEALPRGAGLTDREELTLDAIQRHVTNEIPLRALFEVRFGITAPGEVDAAALKSLYGTLCRLPDAHVQQQRIREIKYQDIPGDFPGMWTGSAIVLDDGVAPAEPSETMNARSGAMSREALRKSYGWDDATIDAHVKAGRVIEKAGATGTTYEVASVTELDAFTQTLLHEIGHSVDSILGGRTEAVYGIAGWRQYDEGDFDTWAAEMGGWDKVSAEDRRQIRQAWIDALKSKVPVPSVVDEHHVARGKKYAGVGIVDALRRGETALHMNPINANGRSFVMQPYYQYFYSLDHAIAAVAPSDQAMYAPAEFFAECYVEYYRGGGTATNAPQKGGTLPASLKTWFDTHVDRVKFDPKRLDQKS